MGPNVEQEVAAALGTEAKVGTKRGKPIALRSVPLLAVQNGWKGGGQAKTEKAAWEKAVGLEQIIKELEVLAKRASKWGWFGCGG